MEVAGLDHGWELLGDLVETGSRTISEVFDLANV